MAVRMQHHVGSALGQLRFEPVRQRVVAHVDGQLAVDTEQAVLVWEPRRVVPLYAVPVADLLVDVVPSDHQPEPPDLDRLPPVLGPEHFEPHTTAGVVADVRAAVRTLEGAAFLLADEDLAGTALLDFAAFDDWRVEDEPRVGHPRDPFKRIDVLHTSRSVRVELDGVLLAETNRAQMLLETPLPVERFYIPEPDVRMDRLVPSGTRTTCAYKGHAAYFSTADGREAGRDIGWVYREPLDDARRVVDHVCFWAERTDHHVDGALRPRPLTPWSPREEFEARVRAGASLEFG